MRNLSKDPRTTAKTQVNDLSKSGIEVSKKTVTRALLGNGLCAHKLRKESFTSPKEKAPSQTETRRKVMYIRRMSFGQMKLELFGHTDIDYVWQKKGKSYNSK